MRILAIANQKGGVGKPTIATNLAMTIAHMGERVLVVDADYHANSTAGLNIDPDPSHTLTLGRHRSRPPGAVCHRSAAALVSPRFA